MRTTWSLLAAAAVLAVAGCGDDGSSSGDKEPDSGVTGVVSLGPQCPVEHPGEECDDEPAAGVTVTVSEQQPGEAYGAGPAIATGVTDEDGRFRIALVPGDYVVTSDAGMSCEFMDAHVTAGAFTEVPVPCDTGIR
jgi:hypothetical protein